ncbi:MAG: RsmE family RNA methyltransferase [Bdellovibrionales bacterium]
MRRYFIDQKISIQETVVIDGDLFKHIFKVCRCDIGGKFELLSQDSAYLVEVKSVAKNLAEVLVLEKRLVPKLKKPHIHLVLANPRPAVFEGVVEKAVELGVKSIQPITTQKSFYKSIEKLKLKESRIQKIIIHAMQQTGRVEPLEMKKGLELKEFLKLFKEAVSSDKTQGFMFYEALGDGSSDIGGGALEAVEDVFVLVGGEGGFTAEEAQRAVLAGFSALLLGEQILRVETACVAGISILKSKFSAW